MYCQQSTLFFSFIFDLFLFSIVVKPLDTFSFLMFGWHCQCRVAVYQLYSRWIVEKKQLWRKCVFITLFKHKCKPFLWFDSVEQKKRRQRRQKSISLVFTFDSIFIHSLHVFWQLLIETVLQAYKLLYNDNVICRTRDRLEFFWKQMNKPLISHLVFWKNYHF